MQSTSIEEEPIDIKIEYDKDLKNFSNFNSTIKIGNNLQNSIIWIFFEEAGDEIKNSIKDLSEKEMKNLLNPNTSNFNIKNINQKRKSNEMNAQNVYIEVTKFTKKEEKEINKSMINHVSEYADKVVQRKENRWQVARGLVTTMIEVLI